MSKVKLACYLVQSLLELLHNNTSIYCVEHASVISRCVIARLEKTENCLSRAKQILKAIETV